MRARLLCGAGALLALVLAASCASEVVSSPDGQGVRGANAETTAARGTPSQSPSSTRPSPTPVEPVTIAFGGDVHFEDEIAARLADNPETTLGPISAVLSAADVAMINLESAITTGGSPAPKKYTFRAPPVALRALAAAGIDVATMANNHGMDFGLEGLRDSLAASDEYNFPIIGVGNNANQAYAPYVVNVHGQRLAFIGATQVLDTILIDDWTATADQPGLASAKTVDRLVQAVRATRQQADAVIVYLHWGRSMKPCPLPRQQQLARTLIDAGADILVGGHAHRLLAGGFLQGAYVHYGLGNFVWYNADGVSGRTGVLTLTIRGEKVLKAKWTPAVISGGVPHVLTGTDAKEARAEWRDLRECTSLSATPSGESDG